MKDKDAERGEHHMRARQLERVRERAREGRRQKKKGSLRGCVDRKPWHASKNTHAGLCQEHIYEREARIVWH